jgi:hypothetical protein
MQYKNMAITVPTRLLVDYQDHDDRMFGRRTSSPWTACSCCPSSPSHSPRMRRPATSSSTSALTARGAAWRRTDGRRGAGRASGAAAAPHDSIPNAARGRTLMLAESRGRVRVFFFAKFREVVGGQKREIETHHWIPIVQRMSFACTFAHKRCLHSSWCHQ